MPAGDINGWGRPEYFAFMATGMLINAIVETFFMPNCANFSELAPARFGSHSVPGQGCGVRLGVPS